MPESAQQLYIVMISIHGLLRGRDLELGRDADTGGQTKYVLDLARAVGEHPNVKRVELATRKIIDDVDDDYAQAIEDISEQARIVRFQAGPGKYLPKEQLWDYLDGFADELIEWFQQQPEMPDILHSHYADAGYVAARISHITEIPVVHTGHSLGRDKRKRLIASGMTASQLEEKYKISRRIEAEEEVLATAELVITSTRQEINDQYELYDFYMPDKMKVIPPGTSLKQFHPPEIGERDFNLAKSIRKFLDEPLKPIILALSRPDPRKNIASLMRAYGESPELQELANLVVVAGNREDIRNMDEGAQDVLSELLILIDYYDLYGKVALPKRHLPEEVSALYRMVANSRGVFTNCALTEPFGLTLLEAAACGLPFVATENGGPVDIVKNCHSGLLVDPLDTKAIAEAIKKLLLDEELWRSQSNNGIESVAEKYSWQAHANSYLDSIASLIADPSKQPKASPFKKAYRAVNRMIVTDLDKTLLSDTIGLQKLCKVLSERRKECVFGLATSRRLDGVLIQLRKFNIPRPDVLICSLGTEIYYSSNLIFSTDWANHVDYNWNPKAIRRILAKHPSLELQDEAEQSRFKISYNVKQGQTEPSPEELMSILRQDDQALNLFMSDGHHIDITPVRASKGLALRYVAHIWEIPFENILVSGGSGTDEDMMYGNTLSVVVSNRRHEALSEEAAENNIYFAKEPNALGVLEAIDHYRFFEKNTTGGSRRDNAIIEQQDV